jgi:hypothetical protein
MIVMMVPVIQFLKRLAKERSEPQVNDEKLLEEAVKIAQPTKLTTIPSNSFFHAPNPVRPPQPPNTGRIQYSKPVDEIERVKNGLKVTTLREVGEKTFEYYLRLECGE